MAGWMAVKAWPGPTVMVGPPNWGVHAFVLMTSSMHGAVMTQLKLDTTSSNCTLVKVSVAVCTPETMVPPGSGPSAKETELRTQRYAVTGPVVPTLTVAVVP